MLKRKVKADYSRPGVKWTVEPKSGDLVGRVYSTYATRLKRRARTSFLLAVVLMVLVGDLVFHIPPDDEYLDKLLGTYVLCLLVLYFLSVIWPFWPNSRKIRMSKEYFTVSGRRYDMDDIGHFSHETVYKGQTPYYFVSFTYGNRRKKIKVMNNIQHTIDIAGFLGNVRQEILEYEEPEIAEEGGGEMQNDPRSAGF